MELNGQYTFAAPAARVWDLLMDPQAIASCLPGCQTFEPAGDDRYRVVLTAGVAAISGTFEGVVSLADKVPPTSYRLTVQGQGRPGFVIGDASVTLAPDDGRAPEDGRTTINVVANVQVGGLVAQVGQRLLGATARMMMDRFFRCLEQKIVVP
jgi:carbon monoxide dehydrogenase subunit G